MGQIQLRIDELIKAVELREGHHLDLDDVSRATGIDRETLASLAENRAEDVALSDLAKLCAYFRCTAGELLYYAADQNVPDRDEVERREIVASWERTYGADERVPEA